MAVSKKVEIILGAKDKTGPAFRGLDQRIKGITGSQAAMAAAGVAAAAAIGAAVMQAARHYARMVDEMATLGDQFDKMSQRTGESVEALSEWDYVAQRSGSSIEAVEKGIRKLSVSMYDAQRGSVEYVEAFDRLGVSTQDASGKMLPASAMLVELADALNRVGSDTERTALAQKLLGRSGAELLPMLQQGSAAISEQIDRVRMLGGVMTGEFATASAEYQDRMLDLKKAWDGFKMSITEPVIEPAADALDGLSRMVAVLAGNYNSAADAAERLTLAQKQKNTEEEFWSEYDPADFMPGAKKVGYVAPASWTAALDPQYDEMMKWAEEVSDVLWNADLDRQLGGLWKDEPWADPMADWEALSDSMWADNLDKDLMKVRDGITEVGKEGDRVGQALAASFASAFHQILTGSGDLEGVFNSLLSTGLSIGLTSLFGFKDGGSIPAAAHGMMVPDGPRGLDSRLIRAMPGELVIDRSTTMSLQRFLANADAAVIPMSGSGGAAVVNQYIARPVKQADVLRLGYDTRDAMKHANRGYL